MTRYVQRYNDEPFKIAAKFIDRCCDCGLVHVNTITVERRGKRNVLYMTASRDTKRTANSRRNKGWRKR